MHSIVFPRVSLVYKIALRMSSTKLTYESNKSTIEQIRKHIKDGQVNYNECTNLKDMENYLLRTGVTLSELDKLSVIHVAGTKGKGSTSAMCESILRAHGFHTGFYSSPHLISVCERIRLNGYILSKTKFAEHFHEVYDDLYKTQEFNGDMPKYFSFLTVLAFNVFLKEKVDVAIVEVGIGGIVDYTNVLRKVPVVGITALGLDHTSILGNTLPEIAAAKAGIMKPGCEAYTVEQPTDAMKVLGDVANKNKCPLYIVPEFNTYSFENGYRLSIDLEAYQTNASLAIQLAHAWMRTYKQKQENSGKNQINDTVLPEKNNDHVFVKTLSKNIVMGLKKCKWPGRYQVVKLGYANFYLDGAHTKESVDMCVKWFKEHNRDHAKYLIFSATGDRNVEMLLQLLGKISFQNVYFVIPRAQKNIDRNDDNYSALEEDDLLSKCKNHARIWENINKNSKINISECVSDVLENIKNDNNIASVLITGSLHLVGAALSIIDPNLGEKCMCYNN